MNRGCAINLPYPSQRVLTESLIRPCHGARNTEPARCRFQRGDLPASFDGDMRSSFCCSPLSIDKAELSMVAMQLPPLEPRRPLTFGSMSVASCLADEGRIHARSPVSSRVIDSPAQRPRDCYAPTSGICSDSMALEIEWGLLGIWPARRKSEAVWRGVRWPRGWRSARSSSRSSSHSRL